MRTNHTHLSKEKQMAAKGFGLLDFLLNLIFGTIKKVLLAVFVIVLLTLIFAGSLLTLTYHLVS